MGSGHRVLHVLPRSDEPPARAANGARHPEPAEPPCPEPCGRADGRAQRADHPTAAPAETAAPEDPDGEGKDPRAAGGAHEAGRPPSAHRGLEAAARPGPGPSWKPRGSEPGACAVNAVPSPASARKPRESQDQRCLCFPCLSLEGGREYGPTTYCCVTNYQLSGLEQ